MNAMEIVLLIVGAVIFIAGYFVPVKKEEIQKETKEQLDKEIKEMVSNEMEGVKQKVDSIMDETITYAVEKTERAIEKVTNGNIMAVKEYSDTVLEGINKNHKEVLFMYDMLNEKQESLKETVALADITTKSITSESSFEREEENAAKTNDDKVEQVPKKVPGLKKEVKETNSPAESEVKPVQKAESKKEKLQAKEVSIQFSNEDMSERNKNEYILELKKAGKSNVAIAKELGLGIGEVKLVIDLFEGADSERKM